MPQEFYRPLPVSSIMLVRYVVVRMCGSIFNRTHAVIWSAGHWIDFQPATYEMTYGGSGNEMNVWKLDSPQQQKMFYLCAYVIVAKSALMKNKIHYNKFVCITCRRDAKNRSSSQASNKYWASAIIIIIEMYVIQFFSILYGKKFILPRLLTFLKCEQQRNNVVV